MGVDNRLVARHDMHMSMSMSMGTTSLKPVNMAMARDYWYIIAAFTGVGLLVNLQKRILARRRIKHSLQNGNYLARPNNKYDQVVATTTAIFRETTLPSFRSSPNAFWAYFSPPSLGRLLFLLAYVIAIICMLTVNAIEEGINYYENIAFRAAWTTVTQVPFLYLLAGKQNIFSLLTGISYERLHWLHRWVGRITFVSATIHMAFFIHEWELADFFQTEIEMMPMVKYGLGAYGVMGWMVVSSIVPVRYWTYELFVLNHLASAGAFLWALWMHVPDYAMYNVWLAIAFVSADRVWRGARFAWINANFFRKREHKALAGVGHVAHIKAFPEDRVTEVIIKDVSISWRPGQHVYLSMPGVRPGESHPFSISNCMPNSSESISKDIRLQIKAHSGFTKTLFNKACKLQSKPTPCMAFIDGPYGNPPFWTSFETLVLIGTCTRMTFTLPVLEQISLRKRSHECVRRVVFCWIVRHRRETEHLLPRIEQFVNRAIEKGIDVKVYLHITCRPAIESARASSENIDDVVQLTEKAPAKCICETNKDRSPATCCCGPNGTCCGDFDEAINPKPSPSSTSSENDENLPFPIHYGRPNIEKIIVPAIEAAEGETVIGVCANPALSTRISNFVVWLCDERAVEKGSGAHGIQLFTEGWR